LVCDGREFATEELPELFAVIGYTYGGSNETKRFRIPDYRGYFLRGASLSSGIDPDADDRRSPVDASVVAGDVVGSAQEFATALPNTPITASIPHYPDDTMGAHGITSSGYAGEDGSDTYATCTEGGDGDTRPANVYVAFLIKARG